MTNSHTSATLRSDVSSRWRYRAYICYSHIDRKWAAWLQRAIEWYHVPRKLRDRLTPQGPVPKWCRPLFRDRTEAHADPHLYQLLFEAVDCSQDLIVVCSPSAAASSYCNEEIRYFRRRGRSGRVFCLIVGGDPNEQEPSKRAYPPALLELAEDGVEAVPLAADVRPGGDGKRDAKLKIIAGLLGVRFDELRRRDRDQRRRSLAFGLVTAAIFSMALLTSYYFALLAGQHPPGYKMARQKINDWDWIVPVPIYGPRDVATADSNLRKSVTAVLWSTGEKTHWHWHGHGDIASREDVWTIGQALSGLLTSRDISERQRERLVDSALLIPIRFGGPVERHGFKYGWYGYNAKRQVSETWPEEGLWYASALSRALGLPRSDLAGSRRRKIVDALQYTQRTIDTYYDPHLGGWDAIADQTNKSSISTYTTATAIQVLLDAKRAGYGWEGNSHQRDELIRESVHRLASEIRPIGTPLNGLEGFYGWNGSIDDDNPFEEGVTLQAFAMLLRAEAEAGYTLPPLVADAIPRHLDRIATANYAGIQDATSTTTHFLEEVQTPLNGTVRSVDRAIDFAWYPWAVACSKLWLQRSVTHRQSAGSVPTAMQALGHLLVDLGDEAAKDASYEHPWAAAELLVTLNLQPSTEGDLRQLGFR